MFFFCSFFVANKHLFHHFVNVFFSFCMPNQGKQITLHLRLIIKERQLCHLLDISVIRGWNENHSSGIKENLIQLSFHSSAGFNWWRTG